MRTASLSSERIEAVARPTDGLDRGRTAAGIYLVPEVADVDVDHVGAGVEGVVPDCGEDLLPAQHLTGMAHEVLEEHELAAGEVHGLLAAPHPARAEVDPQVSGLDPGGTRLLRAPAEGADAGEQLFEVERLGQVVVGPAVEGVDLVTHLVAGSQHQDRHLRPPEPDPLEHLVAVQPWQHDVQQDQLDRLVGGHPQPLFAVVRADGAVAVGRQAAL